MKQKRPFNLSKLARQDPPEAFDLTSPLLSDPYRLKKGKPGSGAGNDLSRPGDHGFSNTTPSGGAAFSDNKEWPSDKPFISDEEGRPKHDNGTGIVTDHGLELHDDQEPSTGDATLGINDTVKRQLDDNGRDRPPFNVNSFQGVLKGVRSRLRHL